MVMDACIAHREPGVTVDVKFEEKPGLPGFFFSSFFPTSLFRPAGPNQPGGQCMLLPPSRCKWM